MAHRIQAISGSYFKPDTEAGIPNGKLCSLGVIISMITMPLIFLAAPEEVSGANESDMNPLWKYNTGNDVRVASISADGKYIATGGSGNRLYFFARESPTPIWTYDTGSNILNIAISEHGDYIVVGLKDNRILLFSEESSTPIWSRTTGASVYHVAISASGEYIVAASYDDSVYFFHKDSATPQWTYDTGDDVRQVGISNDGNYIVAGNVAGKVLLFDKQFSGSSPLWADSTGHYVMQVDISGDGEYIVAGNDDTLLVYDKDSSTPQWTHSFGDVTKVSISDDGKYIVAGRYNKNVKYFDRESSTPLWTYTVDDSVAGVSISAKGSFIFVGSHDNHAYFFDQNFTDSSPLWTYETQDDASYFLSISANGDFMALPSKDNYLYVFQREKLKIFSMETSYYPQDIVTIDASFRNGTTNITFQVKDPNDDSYLMKTLETDEYGQVEFQFTLTEDAELGEWTVNATNSKDEGNDTITFTVEEEPIQRTWYVDDDALEGGNGSLKRPFTVIQDAIDNASAWDTIRVFAGRYNENVEIDKEGLEIIGNGSEETIIDAGENGDVVLVTADRVTISGFQMYDGGGDDWDAGIKLQNANHCFISSNNCTYGHKGIYLSQSDNNRIVNNSVDRNSDEGIQLSFTSDHNEIMNNTCTNNAQGMWIESHHNIISGNTCFNNEHGIYLYGSGASPESAHNNTLEGNNCSSNEGNGIYIYNVPDNILTGNEISDNERGIYLNDCNNIMIEKNTLSGNTKGINENRADNVEIRGNTIISNEVGIFLGYSSDFNNAHGNDIYSNQIGIDASSSGGSIINATMNYWGDVSGPYHPTGNPNGEGDNVTDNVIFDPWQRYTIEHNPRTIYVSTEGNDITGNGSTKHPYLTIQKAVNESEDWDTIRVYEGVYEENVVVNKSVDIIGNGSGETVIDGFSKGNREVICSEVGHYDTEVWAQGVTVSGDYAYVADEDNGLVIVDISDPGNPMEEGHYDTADAALGVAVSGGYAYVADWSNGLVIVDISDPTDPTEVGHYDTVESVRGVAVGGDYAYVVDGGNGLVIVDISDPTDPTQEGCCNTAGYAGGVAVSGGYAYVADGSNGLVIVETVFSTAVTITASCTLSHLSITNSSSAGVLIDADHVGINYCDIHDNIIGIKIVNGSGMVNVQYNNIFDNTNRGMDASNNNGIAVSAAHNWWGHPSGPYHPTLNLEGKGNEVTDNVDFYPWLTRPKDYKIHHVSPSGDDILGSGGAGNPYQTIQKAIDMAHDWDDIRVSGGVYTESISIDKRNLTISGDTGGATILDAGGAAWGLRITGDDVAIHDFTIINATDNGILIINSSGVKIIDCAFPENSYDLNLTNSKNIQLINTTFETVNFNDAFSDISVLWPIDLKVTDNRSGFIPNAHLKITDKFGTTVFDGYTDDEGKIPQMILLEYYQNISSQIDYNPYTISVWEVGYLDFSEDLTINSYSPVACELQSHMLPEAIISGELIRHENMDSTIFFDETESTGRSISYFWQFGDGNTFSSPTPSPTYTIPGVYHVNLTVTDDYENTSMASIIVIVENVDPTAQAETSTNSAFEDEAIQFDASDSWDTFSDILSFLWDFGDATQSTEVSPIHVFQEQGEYAVSLTATDLYGGKNTTIISVTVLNVEPWIIETNVTGMHYPETPLHFTVTADDTAGDVPSLEYTWDFGDGTKAGGWNVTYVFPDAGMFNVTISVTDNNGASDSANILITITDPEITTFVSSTSIFQDESVFFNASHELDDGSFVYTWYFGDGDTAMEQEASHIYSMSGTFTPWLMINDGTENTTIILQQIIVSNVVPVPLINSDKLSVSEHESVHFNASSTSDSPTDLPNLIYTWDFGDGSKGFGIEMNHTFSEMGNYTVKMTVNDGKIMSKIEVQIEVQNLSPVADAGEPKQRKVIVDEPVILDASGTTDTQSDMDTLNYTWKIGEDYCYGEVVSYIFKETGEINVTLLVEDHNDATSEDTLIFQVSKVSVSDDAAMNTMSWILILVLLVLLGVIGFLFMTKSDSHYMEAQAFEDVIAIEGKIDNEMFKPRGDGIQQGVVGANDQGDETMNEGKEPTETNEGNYEEKGNTTSCPELHNPSSKA